MTNVMTYYQLCERVEYQELMDSKKRFEALILEASEWLSFNVPELDPLLGIDYPSPEFENLHNVLMNLEEPDYQIHRASANQPLTKLVKAKKKYNKLCSEIRAAIDATVVK